MSTDEVRARIEARLRAEGLWPVQSDPLRFRYFQKQSGPMFCWTVEKDTAEDERGWYYSFLYKPKGKGSRSNRAERWDLDWSTMRRHRKRKDAKARALKLYERTQGAQAA